ncbi:MAG: hypothetical protein IJU45_05730 [Clostridia bacterium]|nr:hypothetical protein [Clostridia bacterium]
MIIASGLMLFKTIFIGIFDIVTKPNVIKTNKAKEGMFLQIKMQTMSTTVRIIFILASSLCTTESAGKY